jgi:predicted nuclease of predicted toxin-antitoxin system
VIAPRYYLDEHIANAVAQGLRRRGLDVLTLAEAGTLGASDEEHFEFARKEGRIIVTHVTTTFCD